MRVYWIAFFVIFLDQITKLIIKQTMMMHQVIMIFGSTLQLTYLENPGMAFGIRFFETHPFWGRWFFSVVSIIASGGLIWYIYKMRRERLSYRISLALILGGAIGNLIDRVFYGRVVDFLDMDMPDVLGLQRWYVFNIADASVVCGMIVMTAFVLLARTHAPEQTTPTESSVKHDSPSPISVEKGQQAPAE